MVFAIMEASVSVMVIPVVLPVIMAMGGDVRPVYPKWGFLPVR